MKHGSKYGLAVVTLCSLGVSFVAEAGMMGVASTDRFGYTGTVRRYDTLANAQNDDGATGLVDTIAIGNRDLSLYFDNANGSDWNYMSGSWWYTTQNPYQGDGWGNTRGNTGVGFLQLYDDNGDTDTAIDFGFSNFDGTFWTDFSLTVSGSGATSANEFARLSPFTSNTNDSGTYHSYELSLLATGLEGLETSPGIAEATDHPDGVSGSFSGLFENTTATANQGFYVFDLALDMTNWAYENRNALTGPNPWNSFAPSYFAAAITSVPEPSVLSLLGLSFIGVAAARRWKPRHIAV